jgi:hypothetical protein
MSNNDVNYFATFEMMINILDTLVLCFTEHYVYG